MLDGPIISDWFGFVGNNIELAILSEMLPDYLLNHLHKWLQWIICALVFANNVILLIYTKD